MQQSETLKKRKKRNLAKVNGLTTIPYSECEDIADGLELFSRNNRNETFFDTSIIFRGKDETRIRMSAISRDSGSSVFSHRVTRNPLYNRPYSHEEGLPNKNDSRKMSGSKNFSRFEERSHFLNNATMNRLKMLILLGSTSGAFPWSWDEKNYRVRRWSERMETFWKIQWFIVTIQTTFLTGFQFYSFYTRVTDRGSITSYRTVFMNSLSVYWYICALYFNVNMYLYKDQIRQYINTLLAFNRRYMDEFVLHTDGYKDGGRILINLSIPSNCSQVFASVALFLVMPYQPWYLFSYIYPKPWYWLIPGAIQEFVLIGQVITSYMLTAWIVVAHTNSVDFWLRESHNNNDSDYTVDEIRRPTMALETYRSLQILCTCFNDCMSPLAIPLVKIHIMTGLIPCGYVLIRSMNQIFIQEFPGILTYPIGVIDCATAGFAMMSMAAEMHDLAGGFVDSWSKTKNKNFRRVLMSFPTLKVKVARFYFLTMTTTITFFKATFDFITDCIITFP